MPQPLDMSPSTVFAAELTSGLLDGLPANDSVALETSNRRPPAITSNSDRKKSPFLPSYQISPGPWAGRLSSGSTSRRIARVSPAAGGSTSE